MQGQHRLIALMGYLTVSIKEHLKVMARKKRNISEDVVFGSWHFHSKREEHHEQFRPISLLSVEARRLVLYLKANSLIFPCKKQESQVCLDVWNKVA